MRSSKLTRKTPLRSQTALKHSVKLRSPARDTGPSRKVRALVLARDGYACCRCGKGCGPGIAEYSLQHRKARGVGGDNSLSNLILLCGSATTGCHGHVEARSDPHDLAAGYRLESWQEPALEPVLYASEHGSGACMFLAGDGSLLPEMPAGAA